MTGPGATTTFFWLSLLKHSFVTVTIAHMVQSRRVSFDRSIEETAMNLGSPPARTFFQVALPIIAPAVIIG